ncbi:MAG TPA: PAS domain-containing protein, partial [Polyangiaceae bacterium]|nr:PAS domain-containing protein [Polyangiaceae bacterium]
MTADPLQSRARLVCRALEHAPIGIAVIGRDARCLAANRTLASWALPPREPDAMQGERFQTDRSAVLAAAVERAVQGSEGLVEVDWAPLLDRAGHWRLHVMPFGIENEAEALSVVIEDLTEQALAADAFEASERRFRTLVDGATDAIAVHRNGVLLYVNSAGLRVLGYDSAAEIVGYPWLDFVHPEYRRGVSERAAELGRTGRLGPDEVVFL